MFPCVFLNLWSQQKTSPLLNLLKKLILLSFQKTDPVVFSTSFWISKTDSVVFSKKRGVFWRVSPSLGAFGTWWTCPRSGFWSNFACFGSKTYFLMQFLNDSAWFCMEKVKKHSFETKNKKKIKNTKRNLRKYVNKKQTIRTNIAFKVPCTLP